MACSLDDDVTSTVDIKSIANNVASLNFFIAVDVKATTENDLYKALHKHILHVLRHFGDYANYQQGTTSNLT